MSSRKRHKKKRKLNRRGVILVCITSVCVLMMMSYAWYYYQTHREARSEDREVMPPYCLYLVDPNGTDVLQLTVGNLHPGETKQLVVGVSNQDPEGTEENPFNIGRNSSFHYELELAYTKNLPVSYQVYALEKTEEQNPGGDVVNVQWEDENRQPVSQTFLRTALSKNTSASESLTNKNNDEMYGTAQVASTVNLGQYDVYDKTSGVSFDLETRLDENGTVQFDLDYYLIEIEWNDSISFSDYLKETDLVYVMVKAQQLEPEEATTQAVTP